MTRLLGLLATVGVLVLASGSAQAAFPGRSGLLVLQPAHGSGLVLTDSRGRSRQVICTDALLCGRPRVPRFAPDGLEIVFTDAATGRPVIVAADGTCLWCLLGPPLTRLTGATAAFTSPGPAVTVAGAQGLWQLSLIGRKAKALLSGRVQDAARSAAGALVYVLRGSIWLQRPRRGGIRRLARGSQPSFTPDGRRLAFVHGGWIWSISTRRGAPARLVRGSSPAFSPDGHQLSFIGSGGRVFVAGVRGRHARLVPGVRARALDWQPIPRAAASRCAVPPSQPLVAQTPEAVVSTNSSTWWGCLIATGKRWALVSQASGSTTAAGQVQLAGRFAAAVVGESDKAGACSTSVIRFDLATGTPAGLYSLDCTSPGQHGVDSLVLNSSGFTGWHAFEQVALPQPLVGVACPTSGLCVAVDGHGNVATSPSPTGGAGAWALNKDAPSFTGPIACAGTSLCVAAQGGSIVTSTDPSGGPGAWSPPVTVDTSSIAAVDCPSISLCVAVDNAGNVLTSNDPTGGAAAWTSTAGAPGDFLTGVSCPSASLCVAVGAKGIVLTSTNPASGTWSSSTAEAGVSGLGGVSCPSHTLCVATDSNGNVLTEDPSGSGIWSIAPLPVNPSLSRIAPMCPSASFCLIAYGAGIMTSTSPKTPSSWTATQLVTAPNSLAALGCVPGVASTLCLATDASGDVITSTDPAGGAGAWTAAPVDVPPCGACVAEQVYAQDDRGRQALDSVLPGPGQLLANLALNGTVLSWTHSSQTESAQLR